MKYHFIGDQGISMGGVKKLIASMGNEVSGSDLKTGGHKAENITPDINIVVRTSAVNPGSAGWAEVEQAQKMGIKVMKRSELLGEITKNKKLIAISGMHGKTTVSSLAGLLLLEAGFDPTILIGERVKELNNEVLRIGKSDWFVAEVCEYDRSFLDFSPKILILTNIEEEHLDTYPGGLPEILEAFTQYLKKIPNDGTIIACSDDKNILEAIKKSQTKAKVIFYGRSAEKYNDVKFNLSLPGEHNRLNAMAVLALADYLEIDREIAQNVLQNFHGAKRRFELKGNFQGADIIDDYGHHPTEIKATLNALTEKYPDKKKIIVFWPHQYKRIKPLIKQFAEAFDDADEIIIKPIYFVPGRDEKLDISSFDLVDMITKNGKNAKFIETDEEIIKYLKENLNSQNVLLTIGIPPVYKIGEKLLGK